MEVSRALITGYGGQLLVVIENKLAEDDDRQTRAGSTTRAPQSGLPRPVKFPRFGGHRGF
jgi:hypothetical protein